MKKPIGEESKAMFHAITVAGRKKWPVYFSFFLFRSSEWQKISAESTFRGIHFGLTSKVNSAESIPRKVDSAEAIVHMKTMVSAASAEFTWPRNIQHSFAVIHC